MIVQELTISNSGKVRGLELRRYIIDFESLKLRSGDLELVNVKEAGVADNRELDELACVYVGVNCDGIDCGCILDQAAADNKT